MKNVLVLGNNHDLDQSLARNMENKGYKVRCTRNMKKAKKLKEEQNPNFILITGRIGINQDGTFFIEL